MEPMELESKPANDPHVGLQHDTRGEVGAHVAGVLADTYNLYWTTHNFHFNVVGPHFSELHALFEQQYTDLWTAFDELAERLRALGIQVPLSRQAWDDHAELAAADKVPDWQGMVGWLADGHETIARRIRDALPDVEAAKDATTADLLTQRLAVHEKTAWMLRAHLG